MRYKLHSFPQYSLLALIVIGLCGGCGGGNTSKQNSKTRQVKKLKPKVDKTLEAIALLKEGKSPKDNLKITDLIPGPMRAGAKFDPIKNRSLIDAKMPPKKQITVKQPVPLEFRFTFDSGDKFDLVVKNQPEFSGTVTVDENGAIELPLSEDVITIRKMSVDELTQAVVNIIYPAYLKNKPEVSIKQLVSPRLVCTVLGDVNSPGPFRVSLSGGDVLTLLKNATIEEPAREPKSILLFDSKIFERVLIVERAEVGYSIRHVNLRNKEVAGEEAPVRVGGYVIVTTPTGHWTEDNIFKAAPNNWQEFVKQKEQH